MKICRYQDESGGPVRIGAVDGDRVHDVSAVAEMLPSLRWTLPPGDLFIAQLARLRRRIAELAQAAEPVPVSSVRLKSPVANPGKFICGAGNHKSIWTKGGSPRQLGLLFKMTSASAGASDGVILRWPDRVTFHEMELAIIIGRQGTLIPAEEALGYVAGYAIGLDMQGNGECVTDVGTSICHAAPYEDGLQSRQRGNRLPVLVNKGSL